MREVLARRDIFPVFPKTAICGNDTGNLGDLIKGITTVAGNGMLYAVFHASAQVRNNGLQQFHGMSGGGE